MRCRWISRWTSGSTRTQTGTGCCRLKRRCATSGWLVGRPTGGTGASAQSSRSSSTRLWNGRASKRACCSVRSQAIEKIYDRTFISEGDCGEIPGLAALRNVNGMMYYQVNLWASQCADTAGHPGPGQPVTRPSCSPVRRINGTGRVDFDPATFVSGTRFGNGEGSFVCAILTRSSPILT